MTTRTDLDKVNDEIEAIVADVDRRFPASGCNTTWDRCDREDALLEARFFDGRRRRLEAELAEARAIEAQTPDMFEEARA